MTFHFQPSDDTPEWGDTIALKFLQQFNNDYPRIETVIQQEFRVETNVREEIYRAGIFPPNINEVNARSQDGCEVLGTSKNVLTYHQIRNESGFPHYEPVASTTFRYLPEYIKFWKPQKIKHISLLYLDIVTIPVRDKIDLDEYFKLGIKFPDDEFGPVANFECHLTFPVKLENTQLDVYFQRIPNDQSSQEMQYFFQWDCKKTEINSLEPSVVREEMNQIHAYVLSCFEASFTSQCKELFEPIRE